MVKAFLGTCLTPILAETNISNIVPQLLLLLLPTAAGGGFSYARSRNRNQSAAAEDADSRRCALCIVRRLHISNSTKPHLCLYSVRPPALSLDMRSIPFSVSMSSVLIDFYACFKRKTVSLPLFCRFSAHESYNPLSPSNRKSLMALAEDNRRYCNHCAKSLEFV